MLFANPSTFIANFDCNQLRLREPRPDMYRTVYCLRWIGLIGVPDDVLERPEHMVAVHFNYNARRYLIDSVCSYGDSLRF